MANDSPLPERRLDRAALRDRTVASAASLMSLVAATLYLTSDAAGGGFALEGLPLDDAWIHQVYARSVAMGRPFQYNPGEWETGATSPLWSILLAPGHWIGAPIAFAKLLGMILVGAAAFVGARLVRSFAGSLAGLGFAIALPLLSHVSFAAVSGMEVPLVLLLVLLAIERAIAGRWTAAALLSGGAVLTRPETMILPPLLCVSFLLANAETGSSPSRHARPRPHPNTGSGGQPQVSSIAFGGAQRRMTGCVRILLLSFAVTLPWLIYCLAVSGRPLPATVYAKSGWLLPQLAVQLAVLARSLAFQPFLGFPFGAAWLQFLGAAVGLLSIALAVRRALRRWGWPALVLLGGFPALYLGGMVLAAPLGAPLSPDRPGSALNFYFARYLLPALPLLLVFWTAGLREIYEIAIGATPSRASSRDMRGDRGRDKQGEGGSTNLERRKRGLIVVLALLALPIASTFLALPRLAAIYSWNCRNIEEQQVAAAHWIAENIPAGESVCVSDAGAIRYFGGHRVVDLVGLNSHRLLPLVQAAESEPRDSPAQIELREKFWQQESPAYFAITRGWHGPLLAGKMVQLAHSIEIEHNTICAGSELLILQAVR